MTESQVVSVKDEGEEPVNTVIALQQKLLKKVAEEELTDELLKDISRELHIFSWNLTR